MGKTDRRKRPKVECALCGDSYSPDPSATPENPLFVTCSMCDTFIPVSGHRRSDIAGFKKKAIKKFNVVQEQQREWRSNMEGDKSTDFERQEVWEQTEHTSELKEKFKFLSREKFHEQHGCWPDQAKVCQIRITNRAGESVCGVAVEDPDACPELVVGTTKRLVWKKPVFAKENHRYAAQAEQIFIGMVRDVNQTLGQQSGAKYKPKHKAVPTYSEGELQRMVSQFRQGVKKEKGSAIDRLAKGGAASEAGSGSPSDSASSDDDDENDSPNGNPNQKPDESAGKQKDPNENSAAPSSEARSPVGGSAATPSSSRPGVSKNPSSTALALTPPMGDRSRSPASRPSCGGKLSSRAGLLGKAAAGTLGASSAAGGEDQEQEARRKTPDYWIKSMTPGMIFSGQNLRRQMRWARACHQRVLGAGESLKADQLNDQLMMIEQCEMVMRLLADNDADFDSMSAALATLKERSIDFTSPAKAKLLAKRLSSIVRKWTQDTGKEEAKKLADALRPFCKAAEEIDDSEAETLDKGPEEASAGLPEEFDPLAPVLNAVEGSLTGKLATAQKILLNDIVLPLYQQGAEGLPALAAVAGEVVRMYEDCLACVPEVPAIAGETLNIFRVVWALADSSLLEVDLDAVSEMAQDMQAKKQSKLMDMAIVLKSNDFWKKRLMDLIDLAANNAKHFERLVNAVAELKGMTNTNEFIGKFDDLAGLIVTCRASLRTGSTHHLEIATHKMLGMFSQQFKKEGQFDMANAHLGMDLSLVQSVFEKAAALWPGEESYAAAVVAVAQEVKEQGDGVRAEELMEGMSQALRSIEGDVFLDENRDALVALMQQSDGLAIPAKNKGEAQQIMMHGVHLLWTIFPTHSGFAGTINDFAKMVGHDFGEAADDPQEKLNALMAGHGLLSALANYNKLAHFIEGRVAVDEGHTSITKVMHQRLQLEESMKMLKSAPPDEKMCEIVADAKKMQDAVAEVILKPMWEELKANVQLAKSFANGAPDMASWHKDLSDELPIGEVLEAAKTTLIKDRTPDNYNGLKQTLDNLQKRISQICFLFERAGEQDLLSECAQLTSCLGVAYIEGLMCALYSSSATKEAMKAKSHAIRRQCKAVGAQWDSLWKALRERANRAARMQRGRRWPSIGAACAERCPARSAAGADNQSLEPRRQS